MNELTNTLKIEDIIYEIRGVQVMLDSDLAKLYGVETKQLNRQVKRNIERFDSDFMFQLSKQEHENLRCQIGTSNRSNYGGRRTIPYVFTEYGVTTLASVLHSDVAINMSKRIVRAFVAMRHYIGNNEYRLSNIETKVLEHDSKIKLLEESFDKLEEKKKENDIYFSGQIYDAYSTLIDIFKEAKNELIIIDSYADKNLLDIIKSLKANVIIITKNNNLLTKKDIDAYNKQYTNLKVIYDNTFHDRFFIIDKKTIYHCGTSVNSIGKKTFAINLFIRKSMIKALLNDIESIM